MQVRRRDKVFISYSHEDDVWLQLVRRHLKPYSRHMQLQVWDDSRIKAGDPWREGIEEALASAQVAVLLVTPAFLDSEFIASVEVPRLLDDARHEGVRILWIPVRPSGYRVTPIERYQAVHPPDRPLASLKDWERDAALVEIASLNNEQYRP